MDNLAYKYNRFLITVVAVAPFVAYFTVNYLDIDYGRIMILLSYVGVFLLLIFKKTKNQFKFPTYLLFYFLFTLFVFYSDFLQLDRDFEVKYLFSNPLIGGLNFMLIIQNMTFSKKYYSFILSLSRKILLIAVLVIVFQQAIDPGFFMRMDFGSINEVIGLDKNKNRLFSIYSWTGGYLSIGFSFVPIFILTVENLEKKKKNLLIWILIGLTFALLTKARWIMLNTLLVFALIFINRGDKAKIFLKYLFLVPLIILISFSVLKTVGIDAKGIVDSRIFESDKKDLNEKTASTRILAFEAFNKFYWDNPFFGVGDIKNGMGGKGKQDYKLSRFLAGRSSQIHVGYLALLHRYGLIGGFFFLCFLLLLLKKLYENAKVTTVWAPFLGILGFAIANLTLVTFEIFYMGFIIVLVADRFHQQSFINKMND